MKPDGSSGATKVGAAIPNIDSVKATIRTYYGATSEGIADKKKSPYITEIDKLLNDQNAYLAQNAKARPSPPSCSTSTTPRSGTTTWRTGSCTSTTTRSSRTTWVQEPEVPGRSGDGRVRRQGREAGLHRLRRDRSRQRPRRPRPWRNLTKVGYGTDLHRGLALHQVDRTSPDTQPSYITCLAATSLHHGRVQGRHPCLPRESGRSATRSCSTSATSGPTSRAGTRTRSLKLPNPTYYLPSPDLPGLGQPNFVPAERLHHGGRRLQRRDRGR